MSLFGKKQQPQQAMQLQEEIPEIIPEENLLGDSVREQYIAEIAKRVGITLQANQSESHEYREEIIPPVITIGTDLDKEDELTGEIKTPTDKWGFWIPYQGTKGKVFDTEVPQFQYGHMGAIKPKLQSHVYLKTYDFDKDTGRVRRDADGKPVVLKIQRVHLAVELSNLKARLNLAENGYARGQQERVIIGGVGQVSPMSESSLDKLTEAAFGRRGR